MRSDRDAHAGDAEGPQREPRGAHCRRALGGRDARAASGADQAAHGDTLVLRLNLASGTDLRSGDGWVNLDVVPRWPGTARGCEVIWDATRDRIPFPDGSVDEVYAGYL